MRIYPQRPPYLLTKKAGLTSQINNVQILEVAEYSKYPSVKSTAPLPQAAGASKAGVLLGDLLKIFPNFKITNYVKYHSCLHNTPCQNLLSPCLLLVYKRKKRCNSTNDCSLSLLCTTYVPISKRERWKTLVLCYLWVGAAVFPTTATKNDKRANSTHSFSVCRI